VSTATATIPRSCALHVSRPTPDTLRVQLAGSWTMQAALPPITDIQQQLEAVPQVQRLVFSAESVAEWDSRFLTFLLTINELCLCADFAMVLRSVARAGQRRQRSVDQPPIQLHRIHWDAGLRRLGGGDESYRGKSQP
jgi:hypothetical protein